jgi:monofunctional biosynthetic peptidoglycan transglycosylase
MNGKNGTQKLILCALLAIATGSSGCVKALAELPLLKTQYPWVHYHGPKKPTTVTLQTDRPPKWTALPLISKKAVNAIIVSEDWAFYQHHGIDQKQIEEAVKRDWGEKKFTRGASTITQQVVRNVFLTKDKNLWRKVKEAYYAVRIEKVVSKARILEVYLNIAEWGEGIFGIGEASQFYFSKNAAELTAKEGAFLAMLLPSPKRYSQSFRAKRLTEYAHDTVEDILDKMTQAHMLTPEENQAEKQARLSFEVPPEEKVSPDLLKEPAESPSDDSEDD